MYYLVLLGSSPLTRGKPPALMAGAAPPGLIPAHAGKTQRRRSACAAPGAHPRSRGENGCLPGHPDDGAGSSPLTRGKPRLPGDSGQGHGLIPAHAGKTTRVATAPEPARAHPRSRGENPASSRYRKTVRGSSPLTRGKQWQSPTPRSSQRLIPAHAGKTHEKAVPDALAEGSSPLTRGKLQATRRAQTGGGLIPAHAGKTSPYR